MLEYIWLNRKIAAKWRLDTRALPLTAEHRELYYYIHRAYWRALGRFPDLIDCRDFNDKIQWLKLFDQSEDIVRCMDKVLVRDYVRDRAGEQYLVDLYQVHDHYSQIDFETLPDAFVIKANNDSGCVILVQDKSQLDHGGARKQVEKALSRPYGWKAGEWAYSYIVPKVLVEEFIDPHNETPPPDYKFYCIEGKVKFCHYIYDRDADTKEQIVDPEGNDLATSLYPSFKLGNDFTRPGVWSNMIHIAEKLGMGHKCIRVDMYCSGNRILVGEMTFWPMGGRYKGEGQEKIGKLLDFDRSTFKPPVISNLEYKRERRDIYPGVFRRSLLKLVNRLMPS